MENISSKSQIKKNNIILLLIIIFCFLLFLGGAYAYYADEVSNTILTGKMGAVDLDISVTKVLPNTNEIDNVVVINFNELADSLNNNCIDSDGEYALCQLYKVSLSNGELGVNVNVKGSLSFNNETTPNLSWVYLGNNYSSTTNYTSTMLGSNFNISSSTYTSFVDSYLLTAGSSVDFYILVWINEAEDEQNDEGSYSGKVRFEDANGKGVTATFN